MEASRREFLVNFRFKKTMAAAVTLVVATLGLSATTVSAQATSPDNDSCVVKIIHHDELNHQEFKYSKVIKGEEGTSHKEYRYQTRTKVYGEIEHKYIKAKYDFVDGGTTKVNGKTVSGHWVDTGATTWHPIPDSVINAVWGSGGVPSQYIGGSESNPKGSVNLTMYGGPNATVPYYAALTKTDAGYTAWGPWSGWSTTNPGASTETMNVESKSVSDNNTKPDKTVYYLPGGGQSDTNTNANWTTDTPSAPWVKIDEKKVVDKAAWDEKVYGPCVIETFAVATASDVCGLADDKLNVPADTDEVDYQTTDNRVNGVGSVDVKAVAKTGHEFKKDAVTSWAFQFTNVLCPVEITTYAGVTFNDACGLNDSVNVPEDTEQVDYTVIDNRVNGVGSVTVNAAGKTPYFFKEGAVTSWTYEFTNVPCPVEITTFAAASASDVCGIANDKLNVPADTDEVRYTTLDNRVNGVGSVSVKATGKTPYFIKEGVVTSWTFEFTNELCPVVITTFGAASATDECGIANDKLNVPKDTDKVDYQTTDNRVSGVGSVNVKAVAKAPYVHQVGAVTEWTFKFTDVKCPETVTPNGGIDTGAYGAFMTDSNSGGINPFAVAASLAALVVLSALLAIAIFLVLRRDETVVFLKSAVASIRK